jgi:hypothetical protein
VREDLAGGKSGVIHGDFIDIGIDEALTGGAARKEEATGIALNLAGEWGAENLYPVLEDGGVCAVELQDNVGVLIESQAG